MTSAVLRVRPAELDTARRAIAALPDAAHVEDVAALRAQMRDLMSLGWVMLLTMLQLPFVLSPATVVVGILIVLLVAQWPALRQVGRASLADAVRSREG